LKDFDLVPVVVVLILFPPQILRTEASNITPTS